MCRLYSNSQLYQIIGEKVLLKIIYRLLPKNRYFFLLSELCLQRKKKYPNCLEKLFILRSNYFYFICIVRKDGVNKVIESKYSRIELFEKAKEYLSTPVRKVGYIEKAQVTENMVLAGETVLAEKTMLNPSRVVTYAINEKDYDKTLLNRELIDPDKQVRLELWAYDPKQFSEDSNADDLSVALSFVDTTDERIEEAVEELQERRLRE